MKLIKDLGSIYPSPEAAVKRKMGIFECPECKGEFVRRMDSTGVMCVSCANAIKARAKNDYGEITSDLLNELFDYKDGKLFWKVKPFKSSVKIGDRAGSDHHSGYRVMSIGGKQYSEHRLIYLHQKGYIDDNLQIDHINDNKSDNRVENLRLVTSQVNCIDRDKHAKGYSWDKRNKTWNARIKRNGKLKHLGCYETEMEARDAYTTALLQEAV